MSVTRAAWVMDGVDPERWKVPAPGDPDEERLLRRLARDLGRRGERDLNALSLGREEPIGPGCRARISAQVPTPCRPVALIFDEPAGLVVESVIAGRMELVIGGGPVPASLFAATTCASCRDRACQALVGKRWPALWPGQHVSIGVENVSGLWRRARAVLAYEEEPVVLAPAAPEPESLDPVLSALAELADLTRRTYQLFERAQVMLADERGRAVGNTSDGSCQGRSG